MDRALLRAYVVEAKLQLEVLPGLSLILVGRVFGEWLRMALYMALCPSTVCTNRLAMSGGARPKLLEMRQ